MIELGKKVHLLRVEDLEEVQLAKIRMLSFWMKPVLMNLFSRIMAHGL